MSKPKEGTENMVCFFGVKCTEKAYKQAIEAKWHNKIFKFIKKYYKYIDKSIDK